MTFHSSNQRKEQKMKKSILLYSDYAEIFDSLTDEEAGKLIKAIYEYNETGKTSLTGALKIIFITIRQGLDRDQERYDAVCERNKQNGKKGGRPRETSKSEEKEEDIENNPKNPVGFSRFFKKPQKTQKSQ